MGQGDPGAEGMAEETNLNFAGHLTDTDGAGIEALTAHGVTAAAQQHSVDVLVFSTGYRAPAIGSVAGNANITVTGRSRSLRRSQSKIEDSALRDLTHCRRLS
jgi:hypothetical protein